MQILFYADESSWGGRILQDAELWNLLTPQGQVALFMHEITYRSLRFNGEKTSDRVRKVVGLLMNDEAFPGRVSPLYETAESRFCYVADPLRKTGISFWARPTKMAGWPDGTQFVFENLGGTDYRELLTATTLETLWSWETFKTGKLDTSGFLSKTDSVLETTRIRTDVTDRSCFMKKKCQITMEFQDETGAWHGGPIVCRAKRDTFVPAPKK